MQNQPEQDLIFLRETHEVEGGLVCFTGRQVGLPRESPIFGLPQFQPALVDGEAAITTELYQQLKQIIEDLG